jgi:hypothetical protein
LAVIATILALVAAPALAADVGFEEVKIANGAEPPLIAGNRLAFRALAPGVMRSLTVAFREPQPRVP